MSKISEEKRETLAFIDAIVTMLENSDLTKEKITDIPSLSVSVNPFDFLLSIINKFVSYEEMLDWLTKFVTYSLPILELGVKGVILSHLKQTIDCNNDPRIPEKLRSQGIDITLPSIDYKNTLAISPMSREGKSFYFGTSHYFQIDVENKEISDKIFYTYDEASEFARQNKISVLKIVEKGEINNVYELARANDFNAFLWFVINKAKFDTRIVNKDWKVFSHHRDYQPSDGKEYSLGDVISDDEPNHNLSLCTRVTYGTNNVTRLNYSNEDSELVANKQRVLETLNSHKLKYSFYPIGNLINGCYWYTNSGTHYNFLKKESEKEERDFDKDVAICQVTFKSAFKESEKYLGHPRNLINFRILPKPYINITDVKIRPTYTEVTYKEGNKTQKVSSISINREPFRMLLFDKNGQPHKRGKYSVKLSKSEQDIVGKKTTFTTESGAQIILDWKTKKYTVTPNIGDIYKDLYECYPKLTVYEFNYDYLMGMQLFDARVVTSQLIEYVSNIRYLTLNLTVDKTQALYQRRISEIVKKIVESTDYTASDCFYSFSNEKYETMLHESELKRSQLYEFNDYTKNNVQINANEAFDLLNKFNDNATLIENQEVIKAAFTMVSEKISGSANSSEDEYSFKIGFVNKLITSLSTIIIETLLTPKMVLLLKVNEELMGGSDYLNFDDFLQSLGGVITGIVKEIRDLILQEILRWALQILKDMADKLSKLLLEEQISYYTRLMKLLLKACSFKRKLVDTELDVVDYADIDEVKDQPINNEC
ncbi:MAG: hypothetical protein IKT40_02675 [Bacilli bacterium]|nr:hypothetical protein [Bacilli bacterium]